MPIHERTFESVADEFIAVPLRRVEAGEITKYWTSPDCAKGPIFLPFKAEAVLAAHPVAKF